MAAIPDSAWERPTVLRPPPSKLAPPAMGAPFVPRARLVDSMRDAPDARLYVVQGPAGFGKTTLLRDMYDRCRRDGWALAWLTLDAGDNDLDRFMNCIGQAFAQMNRSVLQMPGIHPLHPAGADCAFELAQALAATPRPFMLILDEFEHLHNPAALSVVQQMIDLLQARQHILIGSRELPLLNIARLRMRHQLLEIDAGQLRFSLDETTRFLCEKRGLPLDGDDVERLHRVTDGWAAALWLSSLALENSSDPKRYIHTFSGASSVVASYLAEDVLSHRPRHLQDFILRTSILKEFCADSCDAVSGRSDSRDLLQQIARSNMFMSAIDEQQQWFRYHPLFAGFLRAQLDRQYPGLAGLLHQRASAWYEQQRRPAEAIEHALAAGNRLRAIKLLAVHAESMFLQGRVRLLVRWFDMIERDALAAVPKLLMVYAWVLIHVNRSEEALALLETAAGAVLPHPHPSWPVLKTFSLAMLDRIEQTAPMWDDPDILGGAEREPLLRSMLMIGGAYYYATVGRYCDARLLLDKATGQHSAVGPLFSVGVAGYVHAMLDLLQGQLRAAGARLRALIGDDGQVRVRRAAPRLRAIIGVAPGQYNARYGADSGFASLYLAEVLYETDELQEAGRLLRLYLPLVKDAGIPDQLLASHLIHARILRAEGHRNEALQTLLELEQLGMQRALPRIINGARLERARAALLAGEQDEARELLRLAGAAWPLPQRAPRMIADDLETPFLGAVRYQVHSGQAAAVLAPLKEHMQEVHACGRLRYALRVKLLYVLALSQAGQRNPAMRALREVLQDASAEGFVRIFREEGPLLLALVRDMLNGMRGAATTGNDSGNDAVRAFAEKILRLPPSRGGRPPLAPPPNLQLPLAEGANDDALTTRERQVLLLLAQGDGNQAIGEKLFVSVTTVKTHLRNINLKLGTRNRTEAIAVARRNGLIQ